MKTAVITGANGFLGLNLVEQSCRRGWRVIGLVQPRSERKYTARFGIELLEGDILDIGSLRSALPMDVDAVLHTAASTSVWSRRNALQMRVNVEGTRNVCQACLERRAKRLIHTSTWNTFGLEHREITDTTPQTGGASWINYVRSKFLAEEEVRAAVRRGLHAVILNPSHIIGRYDTRNWARMFRMIKDGTLPGIPKTRGSFCHAEAVALAHLAAADAGRAGENYLLPSVDATFGEVLSIITELVGTPAPKRELPMPLMNLFSRLKAGIAAITGREPDLTPEAVALMMNEPHIASDKAARELGYTVVTLKVMLEDSYRWLKAEGLLD
jgi:nucleoside-diphosphate-sugar epimerase